MLSLTGCANSDPGGGRQLSASDAASPVDRVALGCGLLRGADQGDASTRYYLGLGATALFRRDTATGPDRVVAARLWNASDQFTRSQAPSSWKPALKICAAAGFGDAAALADVRSSACELSVQLAQQRPDVRSYGPAATASAPGDPYRFDVQFLDTAFMILALNESTKWLEARSIGAALASEDEDLYRDSLDHFADMCHTS